MYQQGQQQQQIWSQSQQPLDNSPTSAADSSPALPSAPPKAKVLSIAPDPPKVQKAGGTKILTLDTASPSSDAAKQKASKAKSDITDKAVTTKPVQTTESRPTAVAADAVAKEQLADVDEETLAFVYGKVRCPRSSMQIIPLTELPGSLFRCVSWTRR
jgi:peptide chain release factor subunit 3